MPDGCDQKDLQQIGDFSWRYYPADAGEKPGPAGLAIMLPGADGEPIESWQPVNRGAPTTEHGREEWGWDGNLDAPTLQPSILLGNHWHGYLTAGRLVSC